MTSKAMVTATEFSNKRGELLDDARAGVDIIIRRNNRIAAVMISKARYEKLEALEALFDETELNNKANLAKKKMLSRDEAEAFTLKLKKATKD